MKKFLIKIIELYQRTLSPDHGPFKRGVGHCRFYPSCSEYSKQAIGKYGAVKGVFLSTWRILRCNPWSRGGVDEVK